MHETCLHSHERVVTVQSPAAARPEPVAEEPANTRKLVNFGTQLRPAADAARFLPMDDEALVALVAAGDRGDPLIALYQRYAGRVYGLGLRLLGDSGTAEELVQETFVRLWRGAGRFDSGLGSVRTFIFTIARRAAVDLRRRPAYARLATAAGDADLERVTSDDELESILLGIELRDALQALSAKHREILEQQLDHDLTQQQIADRLGLPLGTVKTRTFHALRALKAELDARGIYA